MAIDTWLLDQHQHHGHPPTLRFYTWTPAAISLGASQRRQIPEHWRELVWQGQPIDLVQRPTGGRGVLHQGDLTYALVTSKIPGSHIQAYKLLCQFLIEGWAEFDITLRFGWHKLNYTRTHNCFALATKADLVDACGEKVIGSAQIRRGSCILQHGSMILTPNSELWETVFQSPAPAVNQARAAVGSGLTTDAIVAALARSAEASFDCTLISQPLTEPEWADINSLI
ncbi:biotin--protein ligase [filamentous cyanobacterium CCP3]|nr:biotin--protein ligase [filamentous cyanobacterium CCP3]